MTSVVIASKANSLYLAECEVLAEFLAKNLPNFKYSVIKKDKNEWNEFLDSLAESYGFKRKCCPIVFTVEGELIGDVSEFYDYSQNKFGKVYRVSKDTLDLRARNNTRAVKEEVRRRDKGPNVIEKIHMCLRKAKKKHLVQNHEGYFKVIVANGIPFKVRLTDMTTRAVEFAQEIDPRENIEGDIYEEEGEHVGEGEDQQYEGEGEDEGEGVDKSPVEKDNKSVSFS